MNYQRLFSALTLCAWWELRHLSWTGLWVIIHEIIGFVCDFPHSNRSNLSLAQATTTTKCTEQTHTNQFNTSSSFDGHSAISLAQSHRTEVLRIVFTIWTLCYSIELQLKQLRSHNETDKVVEQAAVVFVYANRCATVCERLLCWIRRQQARCRQCAIDIPIDDADNDVVAIGLELTKKKTTNNNYFFLYFFF